MFQPTEALCPSLGDGTRQTVMPTALALQGNIRQLLGKLHRWSGLAVVALLLLSAATGAVLAFRGEVDAWLNPHLFRVELGAERVSLGSIINDVEVRYPGLRVSSLSLPQAPDESLRLFVRQERELRDQSKRRPGARQSSPFNQVFVDPYSGALLGTRDTSAFSIDRVNLVPFLLRLHYSLFLEHWGVWLLGGCAVVWFFSTWFGLALAWPRHSATRAAWRPLLTVRSRHGYYKLNYDLHRVVGLISLPMLVVVAFTSIYMNLPDVMKPLIGAVSPLGSGTPPRLGQVAFEATIVTPEAAITRAEALLPGSHATFLQRDLNRGVYSVRLKQSGDVGSNGDNVVWVAMTDGHIAGTRLASARSGGDIFAAWMRPLHGGTAFGLMGQVLICLSALIMATLCVTGLAVWLRKRRGEMKLNAKRHSLPRQRSLTSQVQP